MTSRMLSPGLAPASAAEAASPSITARPPSRESEKGWLRAPGCVAQRRDRQEDREQRPGDRKKRRPAPQAQSGGGVHCAPGTPRMLPELRNPAAVCKAQRGAASGSRCVGARAGCRGRLLLGARRSRSMVSRSSWLPCVVVAAVVEHDDPRVRVGGSDLGRDLLADLLEGHTGLCDLGFRALLVARGPIVARERRFALVRPHGLHAGKGEHERREQREVPISVRSRKIAWRPPWSPDYPSSSAVRRLRLTAGSAIRHRRGRELRAACRPAAASLPRTCRATAGGPRGSRDPGAPGVPKTGGAHAARQLRAPHE